MLRQHRRHLRGFTMIELVMVIVLTGIVAGMSAVFIVEPMRAYVDQSRRTALVDDAEIALRRMGREIRAAVPNSVRVQNAGGAFTLQFYRAVSGGRYRAAAPGNADAILEFDRADTRFDVLGGFPGVVPGSYPDHHLVVYNLGTPGSNLWAGDPVMTPASTVSIDAGNSVTLAPGFQFGFESPEQRIYLSDGAITYVCTPSPGGGTLTRDTVIVTGHVTACSFTYQTDPTATRSALATLNLTLTRDGEAVTLLRQVHVENLP
jgi:MSHA biogenesis protein MshO